MIVVLSLGRVLGPRAELLGALALVLAYLPSR